MSEWRLNKCSLNQHAVTILSALTVALFQQLSDIDDI